jgi:hypothetical protein
MVDVRKAAREGLCAVERSNAVVMGWGIRVCCDESGVYVEEMVVGR